MKDGKRLGNLARKEETDSHPAFVAGTAENERIGNVFASCVGQMFRRYRGWCDYSGHRPTQDGFQDILLRCWRKFRIYDDSVGKPSTFASICVDRAYVEQQRHFRSRRRGPALRPDYDRRNDYYRTRELPDHRPDHRPDADDADSLAFLRKVLGERDYRYLIWYYGDRHDGLPPPEWVNPSMTYQAYSYLRERIVRSARHKLGADFGGS